ncbi:hypothetical protein Tco_1386658 [Tanacetum coccineum]
MWKHHRSHEWWFDGRWLYHVEVLLLCDSLWPANQITGKGNMCDNPEFYLGNRRSIGEQLNHGVVGLVNFCKRFVIIKGTECMWIDVCVVGGRLVNVIGCVIVGTASSDGGNECGGLGTDGNKVGGRGSEAF